LHNWQKDSGKSAIKHKKVRLTRKGAKRWGAKSLQKKEGCKIAQLAKDKGKSAIKMPHQHSPVNILLGEYEIRKG